jgi:D-beta-D-heptose 7-phosphate kinase / D-beta-D-heptose 1-phosphate adenosyltransferase
MTGGLISIAHGARPVTVGVVGDLILDRYLRGETERISPEAPIPVLAVESEEVRLGGAGNVVANLLTIGAKVWVGGAAGADENGAALRAALRDAGADVSGVVDDASRPTIVKTRLIARSQQMLRFDFEKTHPLPTATEDALVAQIGRLAAASDVIVASDYAKGTLTKRVLAALIGSGKRVLVDPKGSDYSKYRGAYGITPNRHEAEAATRIKIHDEASLRTAAQSLFDTVDAIVILITLGKDGIYCADRSGNAFHIHTEARKVYDVTGAGDTVIALLARFLGAGVSLEHAVRIANAGAGIVVGKLGAASVTPDELFRALGDSADDASRKILTRAEAAEMARDLRAKGMRIVFTNGCFDLLHAGHARYLSQAKAQGDVLVVGINGDASVKRLKGAQRPLLTLDDRAFLLASLSAVDFVVAFDEDTPQKIIEEITPHVLVKGADWKDKGVVGREWVESHGGRVFLAELLEGRSTTGLVERIRGS